MIRGIEMEKLDVVVIGGGQAGLGISYFLQKNKRDHIVFEQGRVGESWLSKRWDSFQVNTPNHVNTLPGLHYKGSEPDGFWHTKELVQYFDDYASKFNLPIKTGMTVKSVKKHNSEYIITTRSDNGEESSVTCRAVVIASGIQRVPKYPSIRSKLPSRIHQLHTADYRNPNSLPSGNVLIVGSGQSGCQIAEELLSAGKKVYFCTGKVARAPRRYRGRDLMDWWIDMKWWDVTYESLEDKSVTRAAQPQISGVGRYGHTISLQHLAKRGTVILGRLVDIESNTLTIGDDAADHVHFADEFSKRIKDDIDKYIIASNTQAPPPEPDPADQPDPEAKCVSPIRELDLDEETITTVIWATGFTGDFSWLHLPVFDEHDQPIHERGVTKEEGLYFLGFPWLHTRKSGTIYGIAEDAEYIANAIEKQLNNP